MVANKKWHGLNVGTQENWKSYSESKIQTHTHAQRERQQPNMDGKRWVDDYSIGFYFRSHRTDSVSAHDL